jgi:hypothetical protein
MWWNISILVVLSLALIYFLFSLLKTFKNSNDDELNKWKRKYFISMIILIGLLILSRIDRVFF